MGEFVVTILSYLMLSPNFILLNELGRDETRIVHNARTFRNSFSS